MEWNIDNNSELLDRIDISNKEIKRIENYGILEYFYYNDNTKSMKLVSAIVNENYIINTKDAYDAQHYGMIIEIQNLYGTFNYYVASAGNELNFFAEEKLDEIKYNTTIGILEELKEYCNKYGKTKELNFMGIGFCDKYHKYTSSNDIDKIILELKKERELYLMSEGFFCASNDSDMSKFI